MFREKYPFDKEKCASSRPPECVLVDTSGTHVVCFSQILNFYFMQQCLENLNTKTRISHFCRDCTDIIICPPTNDFISVNPVPVPPRQI